MRVEIPEGVVFERLEDSMIVLELSSGMYYSLNPTGALLWELLEESGDTDRVLERMQVAYPDVPVERICRDIDEVLGELQKRHLIVLPEV